MDKNKKKAVLTSGVFLLLIFGTAIWSFLKPDDVFSQKEKRYLQQKPEAALEQVLDGSYGKDYETYLNDQFPIRDQLNHLRTVCERMMGKTMISGVYLGKDQYLLEHRERQVFADEQAVKREEQLLDFTERMAKKLGEENVQVLLVPSAETVLTDMLPGLAPEAVEAEFLKALEVRFEKRGLEKCWVPAKEKLENVWKQEKEQLFYRTDHHWTEAGAFAGYESWAENSGRTPWKRESFVEKAVKTDFYGTLSARTGLYEQADSLMVFEPVEEQKYRVIYADEERESLYDYEMLDGPEPYAVYLRGNQALTEIRNEGVKESERTLLVLKDSYGNAMIPFLANHFGTVYVIDQRYWRGDMETWMKEQNITDLCLLYGYGQFVKSRTAIG